MELRHIRTFEAVARTRSVSQAAKDLHYAQSTVSDQVAALEQEIGVLLLDRSRRRIQLTREGEVLAGYAGRILGLVGEARSAVTQEGAGLLVGALETVSQHLLPRALIRYRELHPVMNVRLVQDNRGGLYRAVGRGDLDLCITFGEPPDDATLSAETLFAESLVVIVPPGHRLAEQGSADLSVLAREPFLTTLPGCGFRAMFDAALGPVVEQEPVMEVDSLATLGACVAAGMGCALLPRVSVRRQVERGEVAAVEVLGVDLRTPVTMTWLQRNSANAALRRFQEVLRSDLAA